MRGNFLPMKHLVLFLFLSAPGWALPWAGGGRPPVRMKPMPQMRILNEDRPGETLELSDHIQKGRYTVVDFFAEW